MSEETNTGPNNLCTTEDAFENFQATAMMSEEDEFITLSDIVPPQPEVPNLCNELNEIPYDNEVVLSSNDDVAPLLDGDKSSDLPNNGYRSQNISSCKSNDGIGDIHPDEGKHGILGKRNKNQKKGRKKAKTAKNHISYQSDSSCLETENDSFVDNKATQDNVHSTTPDKNGAKSKSDVRGENRYLRRTRRQRIPNTLKYSPISQPKIKTPPSTIGKRRGRPRKSTFENTTLLEQDSTNINSSVLTSENLNCAENNKTETFEKTLGRKHTHGKSKASQVDEPINSDDLSKIIESTSNILEIEQQKPRQGRKKVIKASEKPYCNTEEAQILNSFMPQTTTTTSPFEKNNLPSNEPMLKDLQLQSESLIQSSDYELDDMDIDDDICLSKIKENINNITDTLSDNIEENMLRIHSETTEYDITSNIEAEIPIIVDFEKNIDKVAKEASVEKTNQLEKNSEESLLVEDTSKRPNRRKARKNFKYDTDSDEDPFANVELSNDEQPIGTKKSRYCDDDEYIPEGKRGKTLHNVSTSSDSEVNEDEGDDRKLKKKKGVNVSPRKKKRGSKVKKPDDEELSKEMSPPLTISKEDSNEPLSMKPPAEAWATSNEFENFIAQKIQGSNLKIKKVSSKQKSVNTVAPIDIPVLKQLEPKKFIEMSSQTSNTPISSTGVQTSTPYDIPMKVDLALTPRQSQNACEFLNSVVKTTAELGQLMKDKSEDFMKKKINVTNVTGTFKMDYCVRKSFLLFKLARHNLLQMEDDLAKQYDEFLRNNRLSHCREEVNEIAPKPANQQVDSDSDCEIVDVKEGPTTSVNQKTTKINPKTVFLNKELSIKITKKPSADKNINPKPNHTLWINDSVMVKKVKPTQSFLAQDSRNKKPPDYVTEEMVSDFLKNYYHEKVVAVCAPFISTEWSAVHREYACHYFEKCIDFDEPTMNTGEVGQNLIEISANSTDDICSELVEVKNPKSLSLICTNLISSCLYNGKQINEDLICGVTDEKHKNGPLSLFQLCYQSLLYNEPQYMPGNPPMPNNKLHEKLNPLNVLPLKSLAYRCITQLISLCKNINDNENTHNSDILSDNGIFCEDVNLQDEIVNVSKNAVLNCLNSDKEKHVKSLFSLCIRYIQTIYGDFDKSRNFCYKIVKDVDHIAEGVDLSTKSPKALKNIVYKKIMKLMFEDNATSRFIDDHSICNRKQNSEDFTINYINTMSEEAFHSLHPANQFQDDDDDYELDTEDYVEDDEHEWAAQVQMQVLRSITPVNNAVDDDTDMNSGYVAPFNNSSEHELSDANISNHDPYQIAPSTSLNNIAIVSHIKLEPQDDIAENIVDSSFVKMEPVHGLDGMTIIPESIITKSEPMEHNTVTDDNVGVEGNMEITADVLAQTKIPVYNVNKFEHIVRKNKMMRLMDNDEDDDSDEGELLSQSGTRRIWREHEPDHDTGIDINESLLIPQTYEPINIDNAKGVLMKSSSDESKDSSKRTSKKKLEKKKVRPKKGKEVVKTSTITEVPAVSNEVITSVKNKIPINEVAKLTRRMRDKIRQEEKKVESSDSDSDNIALSLKKDRNKTKQSETSKKMEQGESSSIGNKEIDNEIQCNNVDSTEPALENEGKSKTVVDEFTGFSAIDQNEISSYQKFMKYVYDKIIPEDDISLVQDIASVAGAIQDSNQPISPLISPDEPVELLECQPSLPIFDEEIAHKTGKKLNKVKESKFKDKHNKLKINEPKFIEKCGWHIYPVDSSDGKLYQNCHIPLEKLPQSFVDIYLEYRDITDGDSIDTEVDKLANLQTLNRSISFKNDKIKGHQKGRSCSVYKQNSAVVPGAESHALSDCVNELIPSEDEGSDNDYETLLPASIRTTENNMAKDSLMGDNGSDSDAGDTQKIKQELIDSNELEKQKVNYKPGPKSKTKMNKANFNSLPSSESLMLTADKMMNKELNLLHAPIVKKEEPREITTKEHSPKDEMKPRKKSLRNSNFRSRLKTEDDSSSEEEKQWVSTKEKLLKRVGKKEDAIVDDAKRAKLVDDFIERRGEGPKNRRSSARGSRRSQKKFLEKLKQQRVLSNELLGEPTTDLSPGGKRGANVSLFKGRRNIRQVIDKKSLQKSTVLANMEEFERKRRLNAKQNRLRELLGCEEGVNVLVINDEVCLEYDFEEQRPVVTVHSFFTKVMKAHQYEGVKFMWDACFESLSSIESGQGGGGCILAHCMGLGKTLQVLALLHTVLTHPRAGMNRVLVCCPLSTVLNWVDEIHKWIGPVTNQIKVFELSKLKKTYERAYQLEDWYNGGGIFIIGYELFRSLTTLDPMIDDVRPTIINKIRSALLDPGPDIIICDEGHLLKNDCSVLAVAMSRVVTKRRIVLTGTPMQNNLREYYCMVNFIKPKLLGTYSEYSNRFGNPIMNGQHRDSVEEDIRLMKARTHILHKVLEGCLQRQEASVLYPYLPKKHEYTMFIPLTKCQWDLYKHYMHHYTKKSKNSVLRDFHILQKIWSHPLVLHNFQTRYHARKKEVKSEKIEDDLALEDKEDIKPPDTETWWLQYLADGAMLNSIDSSNKFVAVFRILHECIALGDKVLIFSTSLDCLDALECFLLQNNGWNLGQEYYRLDGSVPPEVRQKWVREYNAENNHKTKLFLISTRAGCLGLNMTAANRVIILDTSWNPAHDIQSIFRVYRFGQKKDCYIYRLVAMGTMEQKIYERSVTKQAVACRVVDEQQIDRHYNMAELTELYKFDEQGAGVAGGVAVGIADVALLRVARDSAIHAVHEHDSLLRGSSEQGLPEHERAAAWMQFQQEHAHKQMQNDIETDLALKKLQEEQQMREQLEQKHLEAQQKLIEQQQAQVLNIKTEDGPVHDLLVPREVQSPAKGKGTRRKGRGKKIVQCRIPIRLDADQPGPSHAPVAENALVQKISDIFIKYNFTKDGKGPQEIKELVAKVNQMVNNGKPIQLENCDELTASISRVLMEKQGVAIEPSPMPPLTDVEAEPRRRGRSRKSTQIQTHATPPVVPHETPPVVPHETPPVIPHETPAIVPHEKPPVAPPEERFKSGGRLRRKAAIQAESRFDISDDCASQDSVPAEQVIELDDGDWQADASETDSAHEYSADPKETKPVVDEMTKRLTVLPSTSDKRKIRGDESSIILSDDEASPSPPSSPVATTEKSVTALHPSLLTNQNFIKIVAHTYLAGNPMLDEDAATLAAQYSTLKLLKETESSGKPIESGPIYDIAVKVLGESVLRRLQQQSPYAKDKDSTVETNPASSKLMQILEQDASDKTPEPVPVKKKPGPKSRVTAKKEDPQEVVKAASNPATPQTKGFGLIPVDLLRRNPTRTALSPTPAPPAQAAGECILPDDDDDVRCMTEILPSTTPVAKLPLQNLKLQNAKKEQNAKSKTAPETQNRPVFHVTAGGSLNAASDKAAMPAAPAHAPAPEPDITYATISLDSDDDEPIVTSAPVQQRVTRALPPQYAPPGAGPVPVAITGPDSQPIPLSMARHAPAPPPPPPQPQISQSTFYPYPIRYPSEPISVSLAGQDAGPVPISLTGPDNRPVPISLSGPGFQVLPLPPGVGPHATPASSAAPVSTPRTYTIPLSNAGMGVRPISVSFNSASPQQTVSTGPDGMRTVRLTLAPGQAASGLQQMQQGNNVYLVPGSQQQTPSPAPLPPNVTKTYCKPGDILRLTPSGKLEIVKSGPDVVLTIDDDDEPQPASVAMVSTPKVRASTVKQAASKVATPTAAPAPKAAPPTPSPLPKPVLSTPAAGTSKTRNKRKELSSSSSSDSSRSPSPDPLSILKDVVHIQAPERKLKIKSYSSETKTTDASKKLSTPIQTKQASSETKSKQSNILQTVKTKNTVGVSKSKSNATNAKITGSIDLTKLTSLFIKEDSSKSTKVKLRTTKIDGPSTVVGTSKNIILDGRSKSLSNTDLKTYAKPKYVPVFSSKQPEKKRVAPPTEAPLKKKKTEPMTLKDFDIDDIDDIIELD